MPSSLLCETVTGQSMADLLAARDAAVADMVELRLDGVRDLDVAGALANCSRPVLATCRPEWEGGQFTGSEEERHRILSQALDHGAQFVDVEWATLHGVHTPTFGDIVKRAPSRIVLSSHDFDGIPRDLDARARDMRGYGAAVIKVAVMPQRLGDTLPLLEIGRQGDAVVVGMGDSGVPTRLLAARFGSRWSYAGNGVAPGQIPALRMLSQFRFHDVGPSTRIFGVVSSVALHSFSPLMHNAAFAAGDIDAVYVPLQTSEFSDFEEFASALGIEGVSVTIPFKGDALRAAASADELTRQVGAANTLKRVGDRWHATNTDVAGFLAPLEHALGQPLAGVHAAVIGGGGAARAVVVALLSRGARVTVHTRRPEQAQEAIGSPGRHEAEVGAWPVPGGWDLLVNCTPLGSSTMREESPLPGGPFGGRLVYDLTYSAGESRLLREAREAGCRTLDGLPMLVAQAERQFEWWIGQRPVEGAMREAIARSVRCT
jgi:3-dehydroquinate dehydratase / shikimate dehydrogenase